MAMLQQELRTDGTDWSAASASTTIPGNPMPTAGVTAAHVTAAAATAKHSGGSCRRPQWWWLLGVLAVAAGGTCAIYQVVGSPSPPIRCKPACQHRGKCVRVDNEANEDACSCADGWDGAGCTVADELSFAFHVCSGGGGAQVCLSRHSSHALVSSNTHTQDCSGGGWCVVATWTDNVWAVQGVDFRSHFSVYAAAHSLRGWVRNGCDSCVYGEFAGREYNALRSSSSLSPLLAGTAGIRNIIAPLQAMAPRRSSRTSCKSRGGCCASLRVRPGTSQQRWPASPAMGCLTRVAGTSSQKSTRRARCKSIGRWHRARTKPAKDGPAIRVSRSVVSAQQISPTASRRRRCRRTSRTPRTARQPDSFPLPPLPLLLPKLCGGLTVARVSSQRFPLEVGPTKNFCDCNSVHVLPARAPHPPCVPLSPSCLARHPDRPSAFSRRRRRRRLWPVLERMKNVPHRLPSGAPGDQNGLLHHRGRRDQTDRTVCGRLGQPDFRWQALLRANGAERNWPRRPRDPTSPCTVLQPTGDTATMQRFPPAC